MSDTELPGTGIVRVEAILMRSWLFLPEEFEIVNAQMVDNGHVIKFTVKHKEAAISPDGAILPSFVPVFQTKRDEDGVAWHRLLKINVDEDKP